MKCPHCLESFFEDWIRATQSLIGKEGTQGIEFTKCPSCKKFTIRLIGTVYNGLAYTFANQKQLYPQGNSRPLPKEVLDEYSRPFEQTNAVLTLSQDASAAISRKLLQRILREKARVKPGNLSDEIQEVMDSGTANFSFRFY